jgi:hypothetical protein
MEYPSSASPDVVIRAVVLIHQEKGAARDLIQQLRRRKKLQGIPRSTAPQGLPSFVEIEIHRLHVLCIIRAEDLHCLYWYPCFYQMDAGNWSFLYIGDQCLPIV